MLDLAYVALSFVFFALMLAYVRGCDSLGKRQSANERS